ncbi:MAG: hypothetical protein E6Q97_01200 [Desulfurellales bacterium]|nr:MAG: hypothetical protein E6Q97_01200 [Desulfurellales bacterium]
MRQHIPNPGKCPRCGKPASETVFIKGVCRGCYYYCRRNGEDIAKFKTGKTVSSAATELRKAGAETCSAAMIDDGYLKPVKVPIKYGDGGPAEETGGRSYRDGMVYSGMVDSQDRWWMELLEPETARRMLVVQEKMRKSAKKVGRK